MASFETALVALILGNSAVSALIGTRLYPVQGVPDQQVWPYTTYQKVAGSSEYALDGAEDRNVRIQFDHWCQNDPTGGEFIQGQQIRLAFRALLSGFQGTLGDGTRVLMTERLNEIDAFDVDERAYKEVSEYEFSISEA